VDKPIGQRVDRSYTLPTLVDDKFLRAFTGSAVCDERIAAYFNGRVLSQGEQLSRHLFIVPIDTANPGFYLGCRRTKTLAIADMRRQYQSNSARARHGFDPGTTAGGRTSQKNDGDGTAQLDFHSFPLNLVAQTVSWIIAQPKPQKIE